MKFFKKHYLLIFILALAAFLRFYQIANVPPSTQWDETAIGYNAYSILKTGRDEYGQFLPLVFKSFGDYKPGFYVYLTVPFVGIFGLNETAVRLPSALAGIASVYFPYQVCWLLFKKKPLSLLASFALALSPWAMHFSRGAWEANVVLLLSLMGLFWFLKTEKNKTKYLYFSAIAFGLTFLTYQGSKVFIPLLLLGILIFFFKKIKTLPVKTIVISLFLLSLLALPSLLAMATGGGGRAQTMSLFSYPRSEAEVQHLIDVDQGNKLYFNLFHSEGLSFFSRFSERYFNHFSSRFLFFEGDWSSLRHGPPYTGMLFLFDFIFLATGIYFLICLNKPETKFIFWWLLISPLPAALTRDSIQGVRSLNMVLPLMIIIGCGFYQIIIWLLKQKKLIAVLLAMGLGGLYIFSVAYSFEQYFYHYPLQSSKDWVYGYKQVVQEVYPLKNDYQKIIFTDAYGQPYIYWLFYGQYPPVDYQTQAKLTRGVASDVGRVERLDNVDFRSISFDGDKNLSNSLLIGTEIEIPLAKIDYDKQRILQEVKFLNGQVAFRVVEIF